ncbi:hypothetical protein ACRYI5_10875 [Furfurilactobacillus sp. WILCCON 0119]
MSKKAHAWRHPIKALRNDYQRKVARGQDLKGRSSQDIYQLWPLVAVAGCITLLLVLLMLHAPVWVLVLALVIMGTWLLVWRQRDRGDRE